MKKRNIIKSLFILSLIVTILVAGCGKKDVPANESSSAKETPSDDASEIEEEEPDEASSKAESETEPADENYRQPVTYKDYMTEWMSIDYDSIEPISEAGNTYDFNTDNLGYYTNGYIGFNFYQVQGDKIATDVFILDYFMGSCFNVDVIDPDTISFVYSTGTTDSQVDADGHLFTTGDDLTESTINLSDGQFIIDSTVKLQDTIPSSITQDNNIYFWGIAKNFSSIYDNQTIYDEMSLGLYEKKDSSYIDNLYCCNSYNPLIGSEYSGSYYENNQPVKDRLSQEQYPKYVKYIPQQGYYYWTESGNEPSSDNTENLILAKVVTTDAEYSDCWASITAEISAYTHNDVNKEDMIDDPADDFVTYSKSSFTGGSANNDLNSEYGLFSNFNYELNRWEQVGSTGNGALLTDGKVDENGKPVDNKVSFEVNEDGSITVYTNVVAKVINMYGDLSTTEISIPKDGVILKPIDASVVESIGIAL